MTFHRNATQTHRGVRYSVALYRAQPHHDPDTVAGAAAMLPGAAHSVGDISDDGQTAATVAESEASEWLRQVID